ncbi:MAG: VWA domain-containing protein [Pseudomonadota bacterium]
MSRRLPVYLLIDTSGSMRGEPIQAVNNGILTMVSALKQDPHALETVHLSFITFDREVNEVMALSPLDTLTPPTLETPESGPTHLGEALEKLIASVGRDVRKTAEGEKGDWAPLLFVMTDGKPSDLAVFEDAVPKVKSAGFANIIGCAAGPKARSEDLQKFCHSTALLDTLDSAGFSQFFKWVSEAIAGGSRSQGAPAGEQGGALPPPPEEIKVVI